MKRTLLAGIAVLFTTLIFSSLPAISAESVSTQDIKKYIVKCAAEMGVEPEIALSIAKIESGFCQEIKSKMGAVGVYQILPSTARKIGYNPYHYQDNIRGGIAYYKQLRKMFNSDEVALAAYNAGPGNVKKFGGIPPYAETQRFVKKVLASYNEYKTNPDDSIADYIAESQNAEREAAEKEHREILTLYMLNQAI